MTAATGFISEVQVTPPPRFTSAAPRRAVALEPPVDLSGEALDLLHRYDLGELPARIYNQLTKLFQDTPKDIEARLETAAHFVTAAHSGRADADATVLKEGFAACFVREVVVK